MKRTFFLASMASVALLAGCNGATAPQGTTAAASTTATRSTATPRAGIAGVGTAATPWTLVAPTTNASNIAIDPADPDNVLVGGFAGFSRSTDGGRTWTDLAAAIRFPSASSGLGGSVDSVAFDPLHPHAVYAAARTPAPHLWRSLDGGTSWAEVSVPFTGDEDGLDAIVFDPRTPGTIYLGSMLVLTLPGSVRSSQIWKTTDGGASWVALDPPVPWLVSLAIDPVTPSTLYAAGSDDGATATRGGLFESLDGGVSWSAIGTAFFDPKGFVNTGVSSTAIAVDPANPRNIYVAGLTQGATAGLLAKSSDGGATWTSLNPGVGASDFFSVVMDPTSPATVYAVGASPTEPVLALKSTDGGATWRRIESGLSGTQNGLPVQLALAPSAPRTLYLSVPTEPTGPELYVTTTGGE